MTGRIDPQTGLLVIEDSVTLKNAILAPTAYDLITVTLQEKVYDEVEGVLKDGATYDISVSSICTSGCDIYYDGANSDRVFVQLPDSFVSGVYAATISARFTGSSTTTQEVGCMPLNAKLVCEVLEQPAKADINDLLTFYLMERGQVCDCDCETMARFYYHMTSKFSSDCDGC